jgi:hypothetical protein
MSWNKAQSWEQNWWLKVFHNTLNEENKQITYAEKMGLKFIPDGHSPYWIDAENKSILDIGCGPTSLLLKTKNLRQGYLADPLIDKYPSWVTDRYRSMDMLTTSRKGEDLGNHPEVDEVWIYNCLEHVDNARKVIKNARKAAKTVRIFEWVDTDKNEGHPIVLTEKSLNRWLGGVGRVEYVKSRNAVGKAYFGVFKGDRHV